MNISSPPLEALRVSGECASACPHHVPPARLSATCRVFELDVPAAIAYKEAAVARLALPCRCTRTAVAADLSEAACWPLALLESGFDPTAPSLFLLEGGQEGGQARRVKQRRQRVGHVLSRSMQRRLSIDGWMGRSLDTS